MLERVLHHYSTHIYKINFGCKIHLKPPRSYVAPHLTHHLTYAQGDSILFICFEKSEEDDDDVNR